MSESPDLSEDEALAAEHALGVLSGAERAAAEARMARDPVFAALVEDWRAHLAPLLDGVTPVAPPAEVWRRVERALPANENARSLRFWRGATIGSLGLAAASLVVAVMIAGQGPRVVQGPPPPILNASLSSQETGRPMFVAAYDPARHAVIVTSLMPAPGDPAHADQLWIIPADGKPHSLGLVTPGTSRAMPMPGTMAPLFAPGATLAVSVEPPGGSPNPNGPTGPIAAVGKLSKI